jgi:mRNA export factor
VDCLHSTLPTTLSLEYQLAIKMSSLFGKPAQPPTTNLTGDLSKDVQLASGQDDSISALAWSPKANYLAVSSWDSKVRIYDVTQNPQGAGVAAIDFAGPVLTCDWSQVCQLLLFTLLILTEI